MNDLTKGYEAGPEAAGGPGDAMPVEGAGWFVPESDAAEMDPWIAFMRGDEPAFRRTVPQSKKPRSAHRTSEERAAPAVLQSVTEASRGPEFRGSPSPSWML